MANRNSGNWQRFENAGLLQLGSGGADTILNLVPGSLRIREFQRERIINMDRGVIGNVTVGDQRAQEIEFALYRTSVTDALIALLCPAATNGIDTPVVLIVKVPDYLGASTGSIRTFDKCFMVDGPEQQMSDSGQSVDQITFRFIHAGDRVVPSTY